MSITVTLSPSDTSILLAEMFRAGYPVCLTSAPGIGKSSLFTQAAAVAGRDLLLSHPAVSDPTDVKGLPWFDGSTSRATFHPFGELYAAIHATRPTVWAWDDLGQATPAVQAAHMQLLLARQVNGHRLPDCVTIVAATNRRGDASGVSGMLEAVKSRFHTIIDVQVSLSDWCDWALSAGVAAEVIAFLRFRPDLLSNFVPSKDLVNSPSPRTWANVSDLLSLDLPARVQAAAIAGAVGSSAGTEFCAFVSMFKELPSVDALLIDPTSGTLPTKPGTMYALCGALAYRATDQNFTRVAKIADRLLAEGRGEFAALLIRDATRRNPALQQTAAYSRLACSALGKIMTGTAA